MIMNYTTSRSLISQIRIALSTGERETHLGAYDRHARANRGDLAE